jgi:hypothetical protein
MEAMLWDASEGAGAEVSVFSGGVAAFSAAPAKIPRSGAGVGWGAAS